MTTTFSGLNPDELAQVLAHGIDHAGNPVTPFVDNDGGWPLRCCLTDSAPGEQLAIIAFSNFPWTSAYRTTGPVVVHAEPCAGSSGDYPVQFEARDQVVRAYGRDGGRERALVYDLNTLVPAGGGLADEIERILADPRVEFVQAANVLAGCYSFTARHNGGHDLVSE